MDRTGCHHNLKSTLPQRFTAPAWVQTQTCPSLWSGACRVGETKGLRLPPRASRRSFLSFQVKGCPLSDQPLLLPAAQAGRPRPHWGPGRVSLVWGHPCLCPGLAGGCFGDPLLGAGPERPGQLAVASKSWRTPETRCAESWAGQEQQNPSGALYLNAWSQGQLGASLEEAGTGTTGMRGTGKRDCGSRGSQALAVDQPAAPERRPLRWSRYKLLGPAGTGLLINGVGAQRWLGPTGIL